MAAGSRTLKLSILADIAKLTQGLNDANKQVMTTGEKFQAGFAQVSKAVLAAGTAVAGFVGASLKEYIKFDDKLTQSTAIMSGVTEDTRKQMETAARSVATTLGIAHAQAAESYYFLASAGLDAQQSIAALPQVAAFAKAGMFDMARATDLATDAQSALGLTSKDAAVNLTNMTRVTDVLVKANTIANASVEQFSISLTTKAGTAMKNFGIDIEEGVAVLAAFADQGIKAELAGTNFAIVIRDLTTKAIQKADAFEKLNVRVFDATGNMRSMSDILADLEGALDGASDAQAKQIFQMLGFNDKSASAISSLIGLSGKVKEYEDALRAAGGTTQEVADKQMESIANQILVLQTRFKDFQIDLANEFTPELTALMDYISETVLPFIEKWQDEIVLAMKAILGLSAAIIAINAAMKIYQATLVIVSVAQAAFNLILMANPIGLVIAGVAALVIGLVRFEQATGMLSKAWEWITKQFGAALDMMKKVANFLGADFDISVKESTTKTKEFNESWDESRRGANKVTDNLRQGLIPALKEQKTVVDELKTGTDDLSGALNKLDNNNKKAAESTKTLTAAQAAFKREMAALQAGGAIPSTLSPDLKNFYKSELSLISQYGGFIEGINLNPNDPFYGFGRGGNVNQAIQQRQSGSATATGGVVINVSGTVIDPEGAARAIEQLISDSNARGGALFSDLFGINP